MTEDISLALAILKRAMTTEQEGHDFYLKAARTTGDEKGQAIFTTLADDEQKHYNLIKRQHDALTRDGTWRESPGIKPVHLNLNQPLFPGSREIFKEAITTKSSDWEALLFGLDIEIKSYDLYRRAALETGDRPGKEMFEFLASEENGHFDMLMTRYDSLFGPIAWSA